jgi:GTP 3',8-cyclase
MLIDRFDRVIDYLRISITDRCNLRCRYCDDASFPFFPHEEVLRYEEILRFVRIAASLGVRKVRLTGGEPLRRKDIDFLIHEIAQIEAIADIGLTTNAVELAPTALRLKEAGLKRVNVSLDSLKRDRFNFITRVDAFDRVMDGIAKAKEAGFAPIKINTVIIKGFNDDEILDFVEFAGKWHLEVRFIEFMPFGEESLWDKTRIVESERLEGMIRGVYELEATNNTFSGPARTFLVKTLGTSVGFISPMSSHICPNCNRLRLTSDGALKPCLFSNKEYDLKTLLRGNATDEDIVRLITEVVRDKPQRTIETGVIRKCQRGMRSTGG